MSALLHHIRRRIESTGPLSIADYMAECLCHPKHGYYMKQDPFGVDGDFVTAPEISQIYGEMLGLWCGVVWQQLGQPSPFYLVELGGGRGTLMQDALRAARKIPGFLAAVHVHMVEISPVLKVKQQEALRTYGEQITWQSEIDALPDGPSVILANEFFDALPIRQFEKGEKGWAERFVDLDPEGDGLRYVLQQDEAARALMPQALQDKEAPQGALFEICVPAQSIAYALGQKIADHGGALLAIDYGYEQADFGETLQALQSHQPISPLASCGDADVTAHVNFDMLATALRDGGAQVYDIQGQGMFLEQLGITERAQRLLGHLKTDSEKDTLVAAHKRLCDPAEMGTLFKVMCASSLDGTVPPAMCLEKDKTR